MFHLFHYGATRLLERLWMWGQALRDSDHLWLNALYHCAGECRQRRHAVLIEELAHRRALRRRSGDQVLYLNNKKLTEEITQR